MTSRFQRVNVFKLKLIDFVLSASFYIFKASLLFSVFQLYNAFFLITAAATNLRTVTSSCRQRIGRMLVEVFRTAANNGTKLNVNEVMQVVRQIADDTGKLKTDLSVKITHSKI